MPSMAFPTVSLTKPLPPVARELSRFRVQLYGFVNWRELFTSRQLLAAGMFLKHTREAITAHPGD